MGADVSSSRWDEGRFLYIGLAFLVLYGALVLVPWAFLVAGLSVAAWMVPVAVVACAGFLYFLAEGDRLRTAALALGIAVAVLSVSGTVALLLYDGSIDGRWYHQSAVISLADGWNPISNADPGFVPGLRYVRSYPKAFWIAAAALYELVGRIEVGKALHALPLAASFFTTLSVLMRFRVGLGLSVAAAGLAAINPIWIVESTTFYLDGQVASLLLVAITMGISMIRWGGDRLNASALGLALILLINLKFTGLFYAALVLVAFGLVLLWERRWAELRHVVAVNTLVVAVAVGIVGFNPYVQNQLDFGNPFYPVFGEGSIDFITDNTPQNLRGASQLEQVFYGLFSKPANPIESEAELIAPFAPSSLSVDYPYTGPGARTAGFGPLFSGAFVLMVAGLAYFALRARSTATWRLVWLMTLFLATTVLAHPEGWWARYTPQLWLAPVVVGLGLLTLGRRPAMALGGAIAAVMVLNLVFVARPYGENALSYRSELRAMYEPFATGDQVMFVHLDEWAVKVATLTQLEEAGVRFREFGSPAELPCDKPVPLVNGSGLYCLPAATS